jgi:diguanylate cyclase (GGDEF)-like protein
VLRGSARRVDRRAYDDVLGDGFPPAALLLGVVFAAFALWHPLALPGRDGQVMAGVAAVTAALLLALGLGLRRRRLPGRWEHPTAAGIAALLFANCGIQYALTEQPFLSVNVMLVIVGTGVCLVDPRWVAATTLALGGCWLAVVGAVTSVAAVGAAAPNMLLAGAMGALTNVVRLSTLRRLLDTQAELRALSQRDELTGLLNRRGFLEAAQARLDRGRRLRLWFVDVDDLKHVNDTQGHDVGDVLLVAVGTALQEVFAGEVVARLSGDEFAVVEEHGSDAGLARARDALAARLALASATTGLCVSVSTGVATSEPGQPLTELLATADAAMYEVKIQRRTIRLPRSRSPIEASGPLAAG